VQEGITYLEGQLTERLATGVGSPESRAGALWRAVNPVARKAIALQAVLIAVTAPLYPLVGIGIHWPSGLPNAIGLGLLLAVWIRYVLGPSSDWNRGVAEALLALLLLATLTIIVGPAQYPAVALGFPEADRWLSATDAVLGLDVRAVTAWTAAHPTVAKILVLAYVSLLPQFMLPIVVLGFYRDREYLWEYIFHFHVCLTVTLIGVALWPAACAFAYLGFDSLLDQTRFIDHFAALRAGTFREVRFDNIEGLISFPSFHVAGGLMVTWAFRHRRGWFGAVAVLNTWLIAATVLTGAHYGIDVVASLALFAGSVVLWRMWARQVREPGVIVGVRKSA
jgi:PAP2 superfamily